MYSDCLSLEDRALESYDVLIVFALFTNIAIEQRRHRDISTGQVIQYPTPDPQREKEILQYDEHQPASAVVFCLSLPSPYQNCTSFSHRHATSHWVGEFHLPQVLKRCLNRPIKIHWGRIPIIKRQHCCSFSHGDMLDRTSHNESRFRIQAPYNTIYLVKPLVLFKRSLLHRFRLSVLWLLNTIVPELFGDGEGYKSDK